MKISSLEAAETLKSPATAAAQAPLPILIHLYWKWFLAPTGPSWLLLVPHSCSRLLLAPPGSSWLLLAPPGSSWLLLAAPGSSWLLLAPPGAFKSPRRALQEDSKASTGLSRCLFEALKKAPFAFFGFCFHFCHCSMVLFCVSLLCLCAPREVTLIGFCWVMRYPKLAPCYPKLALCYPKLALCYPKLARKLGRQALPLARKYFAKIATEKLPPGPPTGPFGC